MAKSIISMSDIAELKRQAAERFSAEIHAHDGCGGQSFSVEADSAGLRGFIEDFFAARGITVKFTMDGLGFYTV